MVVYLQFTMFIILMKLTLLSCFFTYQLVFIFAFRSWSNLRYYCMLYIFNINSIYVINTLYYSKLLWWICRPHSLRLFVKNYLTASSNLCPTATLKNVPISKFNIVKYLGS
uniref:Uncharacterized protein n=1 Tax=Schizaphis graminum TaxID=13262 RepID=A0A2S2PUI2_SCHGA